jgi:opacity protein-like surface antigen
MHYPRTVAAIAAASLLAAFAAQASKGAPYVAPKAEPAFDRYTLTGGVNYLFPSMNGLDYVNYFDQSDFPEYIDTAHQLDRGYNFGYFLGFGYMISDRYDLQVSWTQLDTKNSESAANPCESTCNLITSNGSNLSNSGLSAETEENLNYQALDATLGQYHKLGDNLMTRVFAGVRYGKVDSSTENTYTSVSQSVAPESFDSSFSGIGPVIGLDMNYEMYDWLGIVAHVATALLIGDQEADSSLSVSSGSYSLITDSDNVTRMIPAVDAKLGATLSIPFMDHQDRFVIEGGYQVDYYFDVVDQIQNAGGFGSGFQGPVHNYANVGFMGPYLNLSAKF